MSVIQNIAVSVSEGLICETIYHRRRKGGEGGGGLGGLGPPNIFREGAEPPQYFRPDSC